MYVQEDYHLYTHVWLTGSWQSKFGLPGDAK